MRVLQGHTVIYELLIPKNETLLVNNCKTIL